MIRYPNELACRRQIDQKMYVFACISASAMRWRAAIVFTGAFGELGHCLAMISVIF